jgi:hypothetical protein
MGWYGSGAPVRDFRCSRSVAIASQLSVDAREWQLSPNSDLRDNFSERQLPRWTGQSARKSPPAPLGREFQFADDGSGRRVANCRLPSSRRLPVKDSSVSAFERTITLPMIVGGRRAMRIAMMGSGGLGGYFGARLALGGAACTSWRGAGTCRRCGNTGFASKGRPASIFPASAPPTILARSAWSTSSWSA